MTVSDIKALQKWRSTPSDFRKRLLQNVFCTNCSVTTIVDYTVNEDQYGILLNGKCKKCGESVARLVEN